MIINLEVILKELLDLANLLKAQILYIYKSAKIFVVNQDVNLMLVAF